MNSRFKKALAIGALFGAYACGKVMQDAPAKADSPKEKLLNADAAHYVAADTTLYSDFVHRSVRVTEYKSQSQPGVVCYIADTTEGISNFCVPGAPKGP